MGGVGKTVESMRLYIATWPPEKQIEQTLGQVFAQEKALKIYLADRDPQHHSFPKNGVEGQKLKLRILISFWYYKDTDLDKLFFKYFTKPYPDVFADSGAFSAMTQGQPVNIDEYATWLKRWKHLFSVYANLDVIKNAEDTLKNQRYLEDKYNLNPLPVFHVLEDFKHLEYYVNNYPYIALGVAGMQTRRKELMRWLIQCFRVAGDQSVFHGFGLTSWKVLKSFRWYSVDSSSWGQGFRFGQVPIFDSNRGKFFILKLGSFKDWTEHKKLVKSLGFDSMDFIDRERNDRTKICAISALSYMKAEQWLRKLHGGVKIPSQPNEPEGLRLHLADTSNGLDLGDDNKGVFLYLADSRGKNGGDLTSAQEGIKTFLSEGGGSDTFRFLNKLHNEKNSS